MAEKDKIVAGILMLIYLPIWFLLVNSYYFPIFQEPMPQQVRFVSIWMFLVFGGLSGALIADGLWGKS